MSTWQARTADALTEITAVIHDAYCDPDDVVRDDAARTLVVPFAQDWRQVADDDAPEWRDAPRPEPLARTWRYREERVPLMRGLLTLRHVVEFEERGGIGDAAMLVGLEYDEPAGRLTIEGASGSLVATVTELDVTAELSHDDVAQFVRRRHGRFLGVVSEAPL